MSDSIGIVTLKVFVQENGIIRLDSNGRYIGRIEDVTFEELKNQNIIVGLDLADNEDYTVVNGEILDMRGDDEE